MRAMARHPILRQASKNAARQRDGSIKPWLRIPTPVRE
jgi:hypothetical protein